MESDVIISSLDEYRRVLDRLDRLLALKPRPGSHEDDELDHLVRLIEEYERLAPVSREPSIRRVIAVRGDLRQSRRQRWTAEWAKPGFKPPWADRGVSPEIVEAIETGWFPARGRVLDVGCGLGDIVAWFWECGYHATGVDYDEPVRQARERHPHNDSRLNFLALDICNAHAFGAKFDIIVDRGCLHGIPAVLTGDYVRNISAMASPKGRMLLFFRAFRGSRPYGDPDETQEHVARVARLFRGAFIIERHSPTYLNRGGIRDDRNPLPGLVFWLTRP